MERKNEAGEGGKQSSKVKGIQQTRGMGKKLKEGRKRGKDRKALGAAGRRGA